MINELSYNDVALFMPDDLTEFELNDIFKTLNNLIDETHFHVSLYRTCIEDFLDYLLKLPEHYYTHFTFHILSFINSFDDDVGEAISFLESKGVQTKEHGFAIQYHSLISSHSYEAFVSSIINKANETLSFYKQNVNQDAKLLKPLDISKRQNKPSYIGRLDSKLKMKAI